MNFVFYLARRFLFGGARHTLKSPVLVTAVLGIFFACTFVLVSLGILAGFQESYRRAVLDFNTHLIIQSFYSDTGLLAEDQENIFGILKQLDVAYPHVASAFRFYETLMPTTKGLLPVVLKGVDPKTMRKLYPFPITRWSKATELGPSVIVGEDVLRLQRDMQDLGKLRIISLKDKKGNPLTRIETLPVTGSFKSGLYNYDSRFVLMDIDELGRRYFDDDNVDGIEIRLKDVAQISALQNELKKLLPGEYYIKSWDELNGDLFSALSLERRTFFTVAFLILMIATLNIFGFNFLFFLQRRREFLILALLGLPLTELRKLLKVLSLSMGAVATIVATIAAYGILSYLYYGPGIALDPDVYFVAKVPVVFAAKWFLLFIVLTWFLCVATSWLASRVVLSRHLEAESLSF